LTLIAGNCASQRTSCTVSMVNHDRQPGNAPLPCTVRNSASAYKSVIATVYGMARDVTTPVVVDGSNPILTVPFTLDYTRLNVAESMQSKAQTALRRIPMRHPSRFRRWQELGRNTTASEKARRSPVVAGGIQSQELCSCKAGKHGVEGVLCLAPIQPDGHDNPPRTLYEP
jgi:hypothetical protein